jgi:anti-sigma regulatory factor (Ser/Thr protein kinase)
VAFVHEALYYDSPGSYLAGTVPFIRDGLAVGAPVLVAVPRAQLDRLRADLGAAGADVVFVDMGEAGRNPGRIIPGVLRAFVDRYAPHPVRIIGEPIWPGRSAVEYPACVQHEALINAAFPGAAASILCPYDAGALDPAVLADAARTHPVLVEAGARRESPAYAGPSPVYADFNRPVPEPAAPAASFTFADAAALPAVRRLVSVHAARAGLSPERVDDFRAAVNEVCTNTLDHADGPGTVRVWRDDRTVVCDVYARGAAADPLAGRIPPPPDGPGGRGLIYVNHVCDLVRIHAGQDGTTVQIRMDA